ncbi:flavin reductase family protein [Acuticoccus sp. I52.16.1]|uniref:flavin reductase family protein n=1 Tax=Acuticoccus sp. I52.16.1 TaxID=2928472 RepID=UPI001FD3DD3A|nr:flavin reductase family protein [Acuticoccus sp. I52.16.1]UOM33899.1 flavin reductase family protein [Acuticoccus sp. I52.16.1]
MSEIDPNALRRALGDFATGVCVVTAAPDADERIGMTVNSFSSVSLDPPLVLFCVANTANALAAWKRTTHYAINVLAENQSAISNRFARAQADKWEGLAPEPGVTGAPLIPGAIAHFECAAEHQYPGGDHTIFVGRVVAFDRPRPNAEPLVFHQGRYRELTHQHDIAVPADALWLLGW